MKKKKLLYLVLSVMIIVSIPVMVGCEKDKDSTIKTNNQVTKKEETKEEPQTESNEKQETSNTEETTNNIQTQDSLGFLSLGISDKEVIKNIGEPKEKSQASVWGADGEEHQTWNYSNKGIELDMIGKEQGQNVNSITVTSPCDYKTKENIGIGSLKSEVINVYKDRINEEDSFGDSNRIVLGSIFDGTIFMFENDKVVLIFVGAAAE